MIHMTPSWSRSIHFKLKLMMSNETFILFIYFAEYCVILSWWRFIIFLIILSLDCLYSNCVVQDLLFVFFLGKLNPTSRQFLYIILQGSLVGHLNWSVWMLHGEFVVSGWDKYSANKYSDYIHTYLHNLAPHETISYVSFFVNQYYIAIIIAVGG
jgi:hypothetical protein